MKNKLPGLLQPNMRLYFLVLFLFAAGTFFFGGYKLLAVAECAVILLLILYFSVSSARRSSKLLKYIESVTTSRDYAAKDSLSTSPMPIVIFSSKTGNILWSNERFRSMTGGRERFFETQLVSVVPGFDGGWLLNGKNESPEPVVIGERTYKVLGGLFRSSGEYSAAGDFVATTYWVDITEYSNAYNEYLNSRPVTAIIMLDNYDELLKGLSDKEKSALLSDIDDKISDWAARAEGFLCKYDRDRYFYLFEERDFSSFIEDKFSVLNDVRSCVSTGGVHATVSVGIGRDGKTPAEGFHFASLGIEMALTRGGDQAVVKNRFSFEFYGGHSAEFERRTKVKSRVMANAFGELISDSSTVYIMGHKAADLDSVGAAVGMCRIARERGKAARIVIDLDTTVAGPLIPRIMQSGENPFISAQDAMLEADSRSLLIVVDTSRPDHVESEDLLLSCNRVAVIDHHRRAAAYIENTMLSFHEPYASSACELVTEMIQYLVDQSRILRAEAEALLAGIVLDTKAFTIRTGSRTFDAAAFLRRVGADTADVKRLLQSDFKTAMARFSLIKDARMYRDGIVIASSETEESRISVAQAADELLNVVGVSASFVVSPQRGEINISGRSMGDINVQVIVEKLGGGGNQSAAGAQLKGATVAEVTARLTGAIDEYLGDNETV